MTGETAGWTIDSITLDVLRAVPILAEQVTDKLRASPGFMDHLADVQYEDGAISLIEIKAWTSNRIIHSMTFRNGARLGDLRFQLAGRGPIPETLLKSPCRNLLGHDIFSGYTWKAVGNGNSVAIDGTVDIPLGTTPSNALAAILAKTGRRHAD